MTDTTNPQSAIKRSRTARLVLMGIAPLALTACEQGQEALVYPSVEACIAGNVVSADDCRANYDAAQSANAASAPRYANRADCVADFGPEQCAAAPTGGFFMPFMSGFLVARALDGGRYSSQPLYRPRTGDWSTGGGYNVGRQTGAVVVDKAATQPQRAITQSRAGFGSRAAARGSWGG